jgi:hypothetical protein
MLYWCTVSKNPMQASSCNTMQYLCMHHISYIVDFTLILLKTLSEMCVAGRCAVLAWGTGLRREKWTPYIVNCEVFLLVGKPFEGFMLVWLFLVGFLLLGNFYWASFASVSCDLHFPIQKITCIEETSFHVEKFLLVCREDTCYPEHVAKHVIMIIHRPV